MIFCDLLVATERRGHHATGLAATGGADPFVWKIAAPASSVVKSKSFHDEAINKITEATQIVIGHTRFATQNNAHLDEAAHPFVQGRVVGAHNGIIYNWRDLNGRMFKGEEWIVDSQAAFALLDKAESPAKALEQLEGYFALTWIKNRQLFLARSQEAPLSCAYVPQMRTLFWNSQRDVLEGILKKANIGTYELWETKPNVIYAYKPKRFTELGTGVDRTEIEFKSQKKGVTVDARTNGCGPGDPRTFRGGTRSWDDARDVNRQLTGPKVTRRVLKATEETSAQYTLKSQHERIEDLEGKVESLRAEIDYLYELLNSKGVINNDEAVTVAEAEAEAEAEVDIDSCTECGFAEESRTSGQLLTTPAGTRIHENCIFRGRPA